VALSSASYDLVSMPVMSLTTLPTELDMQIIEHLHGPEDRKALSSLLRVNKYWRAICEPVLYRNFTLRAPGEAQIKRLLTTLLDTPGLAKHIKTAAFHPTETESYFDDRTWLAERDKSILALWSHAGSIQDEIGSRSGYVGGVHGHMVRQHIRSLGARPSTTSISRRLFGTNTSDGCQHRGYQSSPDGG
jgi:muconolactone delta-isomerase